MSQYFALAFSPENMALQVTLCWCARKCALQMPNCHSCRSSLTSSLWDQAYKSCSFPPESNFTRLTSNTQTSATTSRRLRYAVVMALLVYLLVMDFTKIGPGQKIDKAWQRLARISLLISLSFPGKVWSKDCTNHINQENIGVHAVDCQIIIFPPTCKVLRLLWFGILCELLR